MRVSFGATSPAWAGIWCRKPVELRAQIERARSAGINPTHIDALMAAAMLPELLDCHVRLGHDYGLVPVLPRKIRFAPDPQSYDATDLAGQDRSEEHTSELQSHLNLVCRLLLVKKKPYT